MMKKRNRHPATGRRAQKAAIWDRREEIAAEIERRGFTTAINEEAKRIRVYFTRSGYFDFWPTTGRWIQGMLPGGLKGLSGFDLEPLMQAMERSRSAIKTRDFRG